MKATERTALIAALQRPRFEVIPLAGVEAEVEAAAPKDATITVTVSPVKGFDPTLDVAERLRRQGFHVVPHLSARLVASHAQLLEILARLREADIGELFVVGGDVDEPVGPYAGADELLEAMAGFDHGMRAIGMAGYPESHPRIDDDVTIQAMWDKRRHATYIVSQICFQPRTIVGWVDRVRRRRVELPIWVGMSGPVDARRLMRIATRIGGAEAARFVNRHRGLATRLGTPGAYHPDKLLFGLAQALADPARGVAGLHLFTFNEVAATERWRRRMLERLAS
jgi:methylenetetrahydrofolate reductase (NADPH)